MVTRTPGVVLGILTADCAPVLFADDEAGVIGAAHAGWRPRHTSSAACSFTIMQNPFVCITVK
jgi:copper oxidase (laccase) domain-containing protein